jgi:hypothetical protein
MSEYIYFAAIAIIVSWLVGFCKFLLITLTKKLKSVRFQIDFSKDEVKTESNEINFKRNQKYIDKS